MKRKQKINRREFMKTTAAGIASVPLLGLSPSVGSDQMETTPVVLIRTKDRVAGIKEVLNMLEYPTPKGKNVLVKPNFNTADPIPGSTHNDTLRQLVITLKNGGAKKIFVGDRSGPTPTNEVLESKGIPAMAEELGFEILNFSELPEADWIRRNPEGNHWEDGFLVARPVIETEYIATTCCLKTHQFGGVFTMCLKLSVGIAPRSLMRQLHSSPDQRKMIAELNTAYQPQLILLDGMEAFVDGGPMTGTNKTADIILAGVDRIAVDAVGVAILKELGSNEAIMKTKIFQQEQIKRAVELGLGVDSPERIDIKTSDRASRLYADKLKSILSLG